MSTEIIFLKDKDGLVIKAGDTVRYVGVVSKRLTHGKDYMIEWLQDRNPYHADQVKMVGDDLYMADVATTCIELVHVGEEGFVSEVGIPENRKPRKYSQEVWYQRPVSHFPNDTLPQHAGRNDRIPDDLMAMITARIAEFRPFRAT